MIHGVVTYSYDCSYCIHHPIIVMIMTEMFVTID